MGRLLPERATTAETRRRTPGGDHHAPRRDFLLLSALVVALAVPFAILGPGFFREDWYFLCRARMEGVWNAADPGLSQLRPLVRPLYALVFGVLGQHPMAVYVLVTAVNVGVALALYRLCREWLPRRAALVAAAVWALLPSHSSMSHWAAAIQVELSLLMLLAGVAALTRSARRDRPAFLGATLFVAAGLLYEASLVVALAAAVVIPLAIGGRRAWKVGMPCVVLIPVVASVLAHSTGRPVELVAFGDILSSNLGWAGWGLVRLDSIWRAVQILTLVAIAWSVWKLRRAFSQRLGGTGPATVAIGLGVVVFGAIPFVAYGFDIDYLGQGDRGNMISAVGAALVFSGLAAALRTRALIVVLVALAVLWVPCRFEQDRAWAASGRETRSALGHLDKCALPRLGAAPLVVGPWAIVHDGVEGLSTSGDVGDALQSLHGDRRVDVRFVYSGSDLAAANGIDLGHAARAGSRCAAP